MRAEMNSQAVPDKKVLFDKADLFSLGSPNEFSQFPRLPTDNMLMLDRIVDINPTGGKYGKGQIIAEFDLHPDQWFFKCHFADDPIMPGSLGVDGLCQLLGFYLGWLGYKGNGRALGLGEVKYLYEVKPIDSTLRYELDIKRCRTQTAGTLAFADGEISIHGIKTMKANRILVRIS